MFELQNIIDFDIRLSLSHIHLYSLDWYLYLTFFDTRFDFYSNGSRLLDYSALVNKSIPSTIFHVYPFYFYYARFYRPRISSPVYSLVFMKSTVSSLQIANMVKIFYKKNIIQFSNLSCWAYIKSNISELIILESEHIDLDHTMISPLVFKKLKDLYLMADVLSVESGLFRNFLSLKPIMLLPVSVRKLFHRGIKWTFDLNHRIIELILHRSRR